MKNKSTFDLAKMITDKFIAAIEKDENPFYIRPWNGTYVMPKNFITNRNYRGINLFWLNMLDADRALLYCTFNQAKKKGWSIIKGSKARQVIYWHFFYIVKDKYVKFEDYKNLSAAQKKIAFKRASLKYFTVFNIADIDMTDEERASYMPVIETFENDTCEVSEGYVRNTAAKIVNEETNRAFFRSSKDFINMPLMKQFKSADHYYHTLFHELGHWTGHSSRLNRKLQNMFGSDDYSKEELVAEMFANYIAAMMNIDLNETEVMSNSVAYLKGWLKPLKNDKTFLIKAAGAAQRALDYTNELQQQTTEEVAESEAVAA